MDEESVPYFFAVPQALRNERPQAYIPKVVSLGPFHHNKSEFSKSENYKKQFIVKFEYQQAFDDLKQKIDSYPGEEIKKSYDQLDIITESMGPMMARDALFLLEVLRSLGEPTDSRRENVGHTIFDPWRKGPLLLAIHADIVKLENQIPIHLLSHAWEMNKSKVGEERELDKILHDACRELSPFLINSSIQKPNKDMNAEKYIVGYLYNTIVWPQDNADDDSICKSLLPSRAQENSVGIGYKGKPKMDLPSAAELHRRGVKFVALHTGKLADIRFDKKSRRFYLPAIRMDDRTEVMLRNLVAHEAFVELEERVLLSYVDMMDRLVDTASDVAVLKKCRVFRSDMGCDEEVAAAWNGIGRSLWKSGYDPVDNAVSGATEYYRTKWKVIISEFMQLHFAKPWRAASVAAACILLLLAFVQTYLAFEQLRLQMKCSC